MTNIFIQYSVSKFPICNILRRLVASLRNCNQHCLNRAIKGKSLYKTLFLKINISLNPNPIELTATNNKLLANYSEFSVSSPSMWWWNAMCTIFFSGLLSAASPEKRWKKKTFIRGKENNRLSKLRWKTISCNRMLKIHCEKTSPLESS